MREHLSVLYHPDELLPYQRGHPFEILELASLTIFKLSDDKITFILKIPILNPAELQYSRIYPIPSPNHLIIIPPEKYHLQGHSGEFWTDEDCRQHAGRYYCRKHALTNTCSLHNISQCQISLARNIKAVVLLTNQQLLTSFRLQTIVTEKCGRLVTTRPIVNNNILSSDCTIIVGDTVYENLQPTFEVKVPIELDLKDLEMGHTAITPQLTFRQLEDPSRLADELRVLQADGNSYQPHWTWVHLPDAGYLLVSLVVFGLIFWHRRRLYELIHADRRIINLVAAPEVEQQI